MEGAGPTRPQDDMDVRDVDELLSADGDDVLDRSGSINMASEFLREDVLAPDTPVTQAQVREIYGALGAISKQLEEIRKAQKGAEQTEQEEPKKEEPEKEEPKRTVQERRSRLFPPRDPTFAPFAYGAKKPFPEELRIKTIVSAHPLLDYLDMMPKLRRHFDEATNGRPHVTLGLSTKAWGQIASEMSASAVAIEALDDKPGTMYRGEDLCRIDTATLETIIPYLLRPKTQHDAVAALRALWVDVPTGLLDRPMHASMKLRLDCVKAHTHGFAEPYSYAVASSYKLPNGKKLVQKGQDMRLFISPKRLHIYDVPSNTFCKKIELINS